MRPKKIILVVDEDETSLGLRTFLLETRGYRVLAASDAAQALDTLRAWSDKPLPIHLLITPYVLRGTTGNKLCRRAKGILPSLRALIVAGDSKIVTRHADMIFLPHHQSTAEMLAQVKVLTALQRGPKPKAAVPATLAHAAQEARSA